jgi:hypothetical protein
MLKARTPPVRLHAEYLDCVDLYLNANVEQRPIFRLPDGNQSTAQLGLCHSVLFGRDYLVAWIDDNEAFARAIPATDAGATPITVPWTSRPLPIILAPERRRRNRNETFRSILEHEIVHVNQQILGIPVPQYRSKSTSDLVECFFTETWIEYEAHFIKSVHWPPPLKSRGTTQTLDQWVLLRAYTPAVEQVLRRAALGSIPARIVPRFLEVVPMESRVRLRQIGCRPELITWFQARWAADVSIAMQVVSAQGVDPEGAILRIVRTWLAERGSPRRLDDLV